MAVVVVSVWRHFRILVNLLILRFDGSMKCPSDPGFPTTGLVKLASCAAALFDEDERVLRVGRKRLANGLKSSESEYEGLIFGLEELVRLCDDGSIRINDTILIQGDCKTVVHQVKGQAKSRKMGAYFERATGFMHVLPCKVELQHIPRELNILCDAMASSIIKEAERESVEAAWASLSRLRTRGTGEWPQQWKRACQRCEGRSSPLKEFWAKYSSALPYSRRPFFYRHMASIAATQQDFEALVWIGQRMRKEAETVWSTATKFDSTQSCMRQELLIAGIECEELGLSMSGQFKKAAALSRKYRYARSNLLPKSSYRSCSFRLQQGSTISALVGKLNKELGDNLSTPDDALLPSSAVASENCEWMDVID
jgi:hypothetical protein